MRNCLIFILLILFSICHPLTAFSQLLTSDLLPGLKIEKEGLYDGTSLYGYIDGGSTLYFEYGFDRLNVQEVAFQNEKFTVEYYRMKSGKGAFGIYSVNTFQCQSADQQEMTDCENQYQLQLFTGHHYISIVNTTGTPVAQSASLLLARKLKEILPAEEGLTLPEQFGTSTNQLTGKLKFIQGELGLQNGLPDWSSYFEGLKNFNLWFRQTKTDGKDVRQALVTFDSPGDQDIFLRNASLIPSGDGWKSKDNQTERWLVKKIGEKNIFIEVR
ncbi:MAG: hypothetical protein NTZ69_09180 [Bacteroidia bacterium]|nr:hypothetical protein [Bacteroidia bacterium]